MAEFVVGLLEVLVESSSPIRKKWGDIGCIIYSCLFVSVTLLVGFLVFWIALKGGKGGTGSLAAGSVAAGVAGLILGGLALLISRREQGDDRRSQKRDVSDLFHDPDSLE